MKMEYTKNYYIALREGVLRSAKEIVPVILQLIHPKSVVDVGCGTGTWLSVFKEHGISDVLGIDSEYVPRDILEIPEERFLVFDLRNPLAINRHFDLVITLEVAEHLPAEDADTFVESLTRLGPVILFSAAIPFQGGTSHMNEQWPDYWVTRFQTRGYFTLDPIRKHIWQNDNVEYWYRQNIMMFVQKEYLQTDPLLQKEWEPTRISQISMVHPVLFMEMGMKFLESMEKCQIYDMEAQRSMNEAAEQRAKAEQYAAEAERYKSETQVHREKVEFHIAETEKVKYEMENHRAKAEQYAAEAERYKSETQVHREKAEFYIAETEAYKIKANPRNMSLQELLKALPIVVGKAVKAKVHGS